jgi:SAM-dependent methyltransferase
VSHAEAVRQIDTSRDARPLTSTEHWDSYWEHAPELPADADQKGHSSLGAILEVMDRFIPRTPPQSILEIGGAPGGTLVHFHRKFGHEICALDNSPTGVELTRRNFDLLGVPCKVLEQDMFSRDPVKPQFDVVYSHGLIEHFVDTRATISAHLSYLKPGGILIVGCPNFSGVNRILMRRLSPSILEWHELSVMDIRRWHEWETDLNLGVLFRAYIAGFQPGAFWRCERKSLADRAMRRGFIELGHLWNKRLAHGITHINSRHWSYYAIGVYKKRR